jgi:hypothetical protein
MTELLAAPLGALVTSPNPYIPGNSSPLSGIRIGTSTTHFARSKPRPKAPTPSAPAQVLSAGPVCPAGRPGHWDHLKRPQSRARWDNSDYYDSWYLAVTPAGAIAESFAAHSVWQHSTFRTPSGHLRALATFEIPDDTLLFDLDNASNLQVLGVKSGEVVRRNLPKMQSIGLKIYQETRTNAPPAAGIKWWSSQLPAEDVVMLWSAPGAPAPMALVGIKDLTVNDTDVAAAADALRREIVIERGLAP